MLQLLIASRADVDKAAQDGDAPASIAAQLGHSEVLQLLIASRADVDKAEQHEAAPACSTEWPH